MFQNILKRQRLPKSDKMDPHCKITLPRSAYATDQNCQVIPILLLEQKKMTLFHMQLFTALEFSSTACPLKKHSKECSFLSLSLKISCHPEHNGQPQWAFVPWKKQCSTLSSAIEHTQFLSFYTQHPAMSCPTSLHNRNPAK